MKKIMMIAAMMVAAVSANAQVGLVAKLVSTPLLTPLKLVAFLLMRPPIISLLLLKSVTTFQTSGL